MAGIKSLLKDTAIYGTSSIVGRFLNWCLVPLYTIMFPVAEYGVVTYVYSVVALALVILTYGMETGFFRFANHDDVRRPMDVYSTSLISLAVSSVLFIVVTAIFIDPVTRWMECGDHTSWVMMMAVCVAVDAFTALPFSYLRYRRRPLRFAALKLVGIGVNIALNLFFILLCPWLQRNAPATVQWFYDPSYGIGYIFLSNLISSLVTLVLLIPELTGFRWRFDGRLWRRMLGYSAPLLVLGVAGIMNQTIDKILYPSLVSDQAEAMEGLGIYGANYKIAIIMVMFTQAFRFAYEPFIFSQAKSRGEDRDRAYSDAMKYFIIFGLVIFLGVMFYIDIIRYFISPRYFSGLRVVPLIMIAELFMGICFNLSLWYKLTDRTLWGMWLTLIGLAVTVGLNAALVPLIGYMGCAWAALGCYTVMMLLSYVLGRAYYPIVYPLRRIGGYVLLAAVFYAIGSRGLDFDTLWLKLATRTVLLLTFIFIVAAREGLVPRRPLHSSARQ